MTSEAGVDDSTPQQGVAPEQPAQLRRSLYRAYRPQTFAEIVGQDHVARTLSNAVLQGTVAHGYVFAGPRGTGKTSMARILAKALNCTGPDPAQPRTEPTTDPCGVCDSCRRIAAAESLDVIEMDAASHRGIEDIRELRDTIAYTPVSGRFKVYIIDEAHMLTREAFNALLKTLEEPPPQVVFVLATTEPHKLPDTILSRCQRFDFRRPQTTQVVKVLRRVATGEGLQVDDDALDTIAEHSEGGFRDAIGALERLAAFTPAGERIGATEVLELLGITDLELLIELTEIVADADTVEALAFVDRQYARGAGWTQFINDFLRHLRRLFLLQSVGHAAADPHVVRALAQTVGLHEALIERLQPQAGRLDSSLVLRLMESLGRALGEIKAGLDGRLQLELALIKITQPQLDASPAGLDARLRRLEALVGEGQVLPVSPAASAGAVAVAPTGAAAAAATPAAPAPKTAATPEMPAPAPERAATAGKPAPAPEKTAGQEAPVPTPHEAAAAAKQAPEKATVAARLEADPGSQPVQASSTSHESLGEQPAEAAESAASVADETDEEPAAQPQPDSQTIEEPAPPQPETDSPTVDEPTRPPASDESIGAAAGPADAASPPQAKAAASTQGGPLLEQVKRRWPEVLDHAQRHSLPVRSMLAHAEPQSEANGHLTIAVGTAFQRDRLAELGNAGIVAGSIAEVVTRPVTVSFVLGDVSTGPQSQAGQHTLSIDEAIALTRQKLDAMPLADDE